MAVVSLVVGKMELKLTTNSYTTEFNEKVVIKKYAKLHRACNCFSIRMGESSRSTLMQ